MALESNSATVVRNYDAALIKTNLETNTDLVEKKQKTIKSKFCEINCKKLNAICYIQISACVIVIIWAYENTSDYMDI